MALRFVSAYISSALIGRSASLDAVPDESDRMVELVGQLRAVLSFPWQIEGSAAGNHPNSPLLAWRIGSKICKISL